MFDLKQMREEVKDLSILVVDDEKKVRDGISSFMKKLCHKVDSASDGKKALELLKKNRYDVLITDLYMPKMDGETLSKNAKKIYNSLFIAVISGSQKIDTDTSFYDEFFQKPITFDDLKKLIVSITKRVKT